MSVCSARKKGIREWEVIIFDSAYLLLAKSSLLDKLSFFFIIIRADGKGSNVGKSHVTY